MVKYVLLLVDDIVSSEEISG